MASEKNWPLLTRVVQHIIDHPETWNQTVYSTACGTAFCVAGHAAIMVGGKQIELEAGNYWCGFVSLTPELGEQLGLREYYAVTHVATELGMDAVAQKALGINGYEGWVLFDEGNKLGDILWLLNYWAEEDGVTLPESWAEINGDRAYEFEVDGSHRIIYQGSAG